MNIFVLDTCAHTAAHSLCDQHVRKMTLETAQILCTVAHKMGIKAPYKPTHFNHPCVLWAGETADNLMWTGWHGLSLASEYRRRFGKLHASGAVVEHMFMFALAGKLCEMPTGITPFVQCMPEDYRGDDPVQAYRRYYRACKVVFPSGRKATWTNVDKPWWL